MRLSWEGCRAGAGILLLLYTGKRLGDADKSRLNFFPGILRQAIFELLYSSEAIVDEESPDQGLDIYARDQMPPDISKKKMFCQEW